MSGHDVERAYVAAVLAHRDVQLTEVTASMQTEVDRLAEHWREGYGEQVAGHADRMAAMRAETVQFIKSLTGAADDGQQPVDVGQARAGVSAPGPTAPAGPGGPGPGQPNPHAAELERARAIHDMPVSSYGAQRRADWLAGLQRNADAMSAAAMQAHQQDHDRVTVGQGGIFGPGATGEQMAADVAARQPRVGDGAGAGRDLERNGGAWDTASITDSPCPPRADLRFVDQPGRPTGQSPLARYMSGER